jgi:flagellar hook-basal body complex protein FliE
MVEGIGGRTYPLQPRPELPIAAGPEAKGTPGNNESFGSTMKQFLGSVNDMALQSDQTTQAFLRGEVTDLHQVILAEQEASIAVRLVSEMRDRLLQAYQEVMRTTM